MHVEQARGMTVWWCVSERASAISPTSAAWIQSGELVITSCLNRQMELRRVTGNFLSACFGARSWRVQEWESKITWHRTLAPPLDVFISHSPVTSIWSYSFTFLTGYILPPGLLPSSFLRLFSWFSVFPIPSLMEKKVILGRCPSEMAYITQPDIWMFYRVFLQQPPTVLCLGGDGSWLSLLSVWIMSRNHHIQWPVGKLQSMCTYFKPTMVPGWFAPIWSFMVTPSTKYFFER